MGLIDKLVDKTKDISDSAMKAVDNNKLDMQIRDEEKKIDEYTKEIGNLAVKAFKSNSSPDESEMKKIYEKIVESEKKIEDIESQKGELSNKYAQDKAIRDRERTAKELEDAQVKAAEAAARADGLDKKE